jgi:hypothetical protein
MIDNQSLASVDLAAFGENTLPLPYVIARKMRGPHIREHLAEPVLQNV